MTVCQGAKYDSDLMGSKSMRQTHNHNRKWRKEKNRYNLVAENIDTHERCWIICNISIPPIKTHPQAQDR